MWWCTLSITVYNMHSKQHYQGVTFYILLLLVLKTVDWAILNILSQGNKFCCNNYYNMSWSGAGFVVFLNQLLLCKYNINCTKTNVYFLICLRNDCIHFVTTCAKLFKWVTSNKYFYPCSLSFTKLNFILCQTHGWRITTNMVNPNFWEQVALQDPETCIIEQLCTYCSKTNNYLLLTNVPFVTF